MLGGSSPARRAAITTSALLALTIVHHVCGAIIYQTPWRFHVAPPALGAILLLVVALMTYQRLGETRGGRLALGVALAVIGAVVVGVGFVEGGYNHLLKTVLWAAGVPTPTLLRMFPPPVYVLPSSVVFEATGILQLVLGVVAARDGIRLWRAGGLGRSAPSAWPKKTRKTAKENRKARKNE